MRGAGDADRQLGNTSNAGMSAAVVGAMPVPVKWRVWGTPPTPAVVLFSVSVPDRNPIAAGVKVCERLQNPPAGIDPLHELVAPKSPGFVPPGVTLKTSAVLPTF